MSDSARDRIDTTREQLDRDTQRFERAADRAVPVTGTDSSGTVSARFDENGVLRSVTVTDAWRSAVGPDALAAAVMEAYGDAAAERARQWSSAAAEELDAQAPTLRPAPSPSSSVVGQLADTLDSARGAVDVQASMQAVLELFEDLDRGIDEVFAGVENRLGSQHRGRSSSGHVDAVVSGAGELVSLETDHRWLAGAHAFNVGREVTEAVHDAMRQVAATDTATLFEGTSLERLSRLADDPERLAEHLGLRPER